MKKLYIILSLILLTLNLSSCSNQNSKFTITFIDVGQGDAALVECDGHYMLIDGGNKQASDKIRDTLQNKKIKKLDILAISHFDDDHFAGLCEGLKNIHKIKKTISNEIPKETKESISKFKHQLSIIGSSIDVPSVGDTYELGSAEVEVVDVCAKDDNDSLVLLITYGNTRFLFTGDIEYEAQKRIYKKYYDKYGYSYTYKINLMKMPHHGSYSSTTNGTTNSYTAFVELFMPDYVVISVGEGNPYKHPHKETLKILEQAGAKVYRTDKDGDIIVKSNGNELSIETNPSNSKNTG